MEQKDWHSREVDADRNLYSYREPFAFKNILFAAFLGVVVGGVASSSLSENWTVFCMVLGGVVAGVGMIYFDFHVAKNRTQKEAKMLQERAARKEAETQRKIAEMNANISRKKSD